MSKISIRFYKDKEVRAIWDETNSRWYFSAVDIVAAITDSPRPRIYWGTLKSRLKSKGSELYSKCIQLKMSASDGKRYATDCFAKGNTLFCLAQYLDNALQIIDQMPETTFDEIVDKYVEMNAAHPFMEGNGRSTRMWLDQILKKRLGMCVDWSKIGKKEYLDAMIESQVDSGRIRHLLSRALTDKIDDREIFMKGIDYSYYYEQED